MFSLHRSPTISYNVLCIWNPHLSSHNWHSGRMRNKVRGELQCKQSKT